MSRNRTKAIIQRFPKNIIDMMGGTIAVQTEKDKDKDKGTEFTIRLALRL